MTTRVVTKTVVGEELRVAISDLARLRIAVFREYPYLYDGDESYERRYLKSYADGSEAMAVLALDGESIVGVSTGIPMANESAAFKQAFIDHGLDPERVFYCGKSVLMPSYRGQGLYKAFFAGRETYAQSLGRFAHITFCGVVREPDHPLRPASYEPLDQVWQHFGYSAHPDLVASYTWKDIDQPDPTEHPMMFWLKSLPNPQ